MKAIKVEAKGFSARACLSPCVYEPSDDTLLGIELIQEISRLNPRPRVVVDLGSGTGILGLAALRLLDPGVLVAIDVSPYAAEASNCTLAHDPRAVAVRCSGLGCIQGVVDLLISNPPYLSVDDAGIARSECEEWLYRSWGPPGLLMDIIQGAPGLARSIAIVYSTLTGIDVEEELGKRGFKPVIRIERSFFMEKLIAVYMEKDRA